MPKQKITLVYQFDELDETAKERAREWYRAGALDYEWWESVYEDAASVGLKITGFDLGRARSIDGELTMSAMESVSSILTTHGEMCDTHKLASRYYPQLLALDIEEEDKAQQLEEEYTRELKEEYWHMLNREMEYLLSDECVDETIRANEYEFLETGKRA
jgi:hypothetical protein